MKVEVSIEKLENGYILELNGKRFICKNDLQLARRIIVFLEPESLPKRYGQVEACKNFWKDTVGINQAKVLELFNSFKMITVDFATNELWSLTEYPNTPKWMFHGKMTEVFSNLASKGFIKRVSAQSKKYMLVVKPIKGSLVSEGTSVPTDKQECEMV